MLKKGDIVFLKDEYLKNGFNLKHISMFKVETVLKSGDVIVNEIIDSTYKILLSDKCVRFNSASIRKFK